MKLKKVLLVLAFMFSWHMMDVGEVILRAGYPYAGNGFGHIAASQLYHLGMGGMVIAFLLLLFDGEKLGVKQ